MPHHYARVFILLGLILLGSCKQRMYLTVREPAIVPLNLNYLRCGIINRSYSQGDSKIMDMIEKGVTLEGNLDHKGSNAAIQGVYDYISTNDRFNYVTILDSIALKDRLPNVFPNQMPWTDVGTACFNQDLDFLIVLEVYDTDTKIDYSQRTVNQETPLGTIPALVHTATVTTFIKTGWRIYDYSGNAIIDEFYIHDKLVSTGSGINPAAALTAILNRGQNVKQISSNIGKRYASRMYPQFIRVWRDFFNKGSKNLKIATRRAEVGDWDGAGELWKAELKSPKRKVAGRAYYNMAIYKEIKGDLNGALEMAQRAYTDYRIKEALNYATILRNRIRRIEQEKQWSGE